jgi:hypothetical protein
MLEHFLDQYESEFKSLLDEFLETAAQDSGEAVPSNPYFGGLDALCLQCMIGKLRPAKYLEVGSGYSTQVAHRYIQRHNMGTKIISIDPEPRIDVSEVAALHQHRLSIADVGWICGALHYNDILFIDGSHVLLEDSDVAIFFLYILPNLASGVVVQLHDIYLPDRYPEKWKERNYTEQLMLAMLLVFAPKRIEVLLSNGYVSSRTSLAEKYGKGKSFWFRMA